MKNKINVLAIAFSAPPYNSPQSYLLAKMLPYWVKGGIASWIITPPMPTDRMNTAQPCFENLLSNENIRFIRLKRTSFSRRVFFKALPFLSRPDPDAAYCSAASKEAENLFIQGKFDLLYSWACPHSCSVAALRVKRKTSLPWIAHFSDPWVDTTWAELGNRYNRKMEEAVIRECDRVVFVSAETRDKVMQKYPPDWQNKTSVIPHCFEPAWYPRKSPENNKLTVRYMGTISANRSPEPLFRALKIVAERSPGLLDKMLFEFTGTAFLNTGELLVSYRLPSGLVRFCENVEYLKSLQMMCEADVLLMIDAEADINMYLPSKLIDYMGARRPVLGITPDGASAKAIHEVGGFVASPSDPHKIADTIIHIIGLYENNLLNNFIPSDRIISKYHAEQTTRQLLDLMNEVTQIHHQKL